MQPETYRSLLFVPADSEAKLVKARSVAADALVLDWEDAVAAANKDTARRLTAAFLADRASVRTAVLVRVNPVASAAFAADCEALAAAAPDGVMLSKCVRVEDVLAVPQGAFAIYPMVESAEGLLNARALTGCSDRVAALAFGAEDFSAELGITRSADELELLYARSAVVTAARAAGRDAYESPCMAVRDMERVRASAERARNLGFAGQMAIHPAQVEVIHAAFEPTAAEVAEARRVLEGFAASGSAVMAVDGQMVDEAVLRRARRVVERAERSQ